MAVQARGKLEFAVQDHKFQPLAEILGQHVGYDMPRVCSCPLTSPGLLYSRPSFLWYRLYAPLLGHFDSEYVASDRLIGRYCLCSGVCHCITGNQLSCLFP